MYVRTYVCMYVSTYVCVYVRTHAHMYAQIYVCIYVRVCKITTHTFSHALIHTHKSTQTRKHKNTLQPHVGPM